MKVKEESEKVGLTFNIQKTKIMASGPITSWQTDGETVADFILGRAPKSLQMMTTAIKLKDMYSLEGKLWQHIKKQSHCFTNKGLSSHFSGSHVWMWELDSKGSWALKNWCFCTVVLEKTLESPLDWRRSNQSILKEISPGCSLVGLMLKLKLHYFGHLIRRADPFEKTLMLGKIEGRRRRGWSRMTWLDGITDSMDMVLGGLRELALAYKNRNQWSEHRSLIVGGRGSYCVHWLLQASASCSWNMFMAACH